MAIYDAGTASLAADGTVIGVGTTWRQPLTLIRVGATMIFNTTPASIVTIAEIISDTEIRVFNDKGFNTPAGTQYSILAHDGITVQALAQNVAETLRYYQSRETEVAAAVEAFSNFDANSFQDDLNQVNTKSLQVANDAAQVSSDKAQVSADKDSAASSAASALSYKNAAAASAAEAADSAASLDTSSLLMVDRNLSDLSDKSIARSNLDVYSKAEVDTVREITKGGTGAATAEAARSNLDVYSKSEVDTVREITKGGTGAATAEAARSNLDVYSKSEVDSLISDSSSNEFQNKVVYSTASPINSNQTINFSESLIGKTVYIRLGDIDISATSWTVINPIPGFAMTVPSNLGRGRRFTLSVDGLSAYIDSEDFGVIHTVMI